MIPVILDVFVLLRNNLIFTKINLSYKNSYFFFYNLFLKNFFFFFLDTCIIKFLSSIAFKNNNNNIFFFKTKQLNSNTFFLKNVFIKDIFSSYVFKLFRLLSIWIISVVVCLSIFYYLSNIRNISFNKVIFEWFLIIMFLYWLLSGFTFFIKKYQFSKYTSVIQRFWRRTYIIFWLIETGVFLTFFYLTLNASSEPIYMYDQINLFRSHLFSWRTFFLKIFLNIYLIFISYYLLTTINFSNFKKQNILIVLITLLLLYFVWLEFYQFFHIINFYANLIWLFDFDEFVWNLEIEFRRTRMSNNYVALCLLAKFWHLIFIFVFWVFFILRINELGRVRYPLYSANCQNFIILYIMSWLFMYPWLKFFFRGLLDINYFWFFNNSNKISNRLFITDLKLFYFNILYSKINTHFFYKNDFFYFFESSKNLIISWKKHFIKDLILNNLFYN